MAYKYKYIEFNKLAVIVNIIFNIFYLYGFIVFNNFTVWQNYFQEYSIDQKYRIFRIQI